MKITPELAKYIQNVITIAQLVDIEDIIIEPGMVRGMNLARTAAIIHDQNVPEFPCTLGLTRMHVLNSRLNIINTMENFNIDVVTREGTSHAMSLTLKAKGTKIDYRCGDPSLIQAKKKINDPLVYRVTVTPDFVDLLQRGIASMKSEAVSIICNSEGVSFELLDDNKDVFKHTFADNVELIGDTPSGNSAKFAYRYPAKLLLSVLKKEPTHFDVGAIGLIKMLVCGINVLLIPCE